MSASSSHVLSPPQFIAKWSRADLSERAASQEHFIDLCRMLGQPTPAEHDSTGAEYTFEKGVQPRKNVQKAKKREAERFKTSGLALWSEYEPQGLGQTVQNVGTQRPFAGEELVEHTRSDAGFGRQIT